MLAYLYKGSLIITHKGYSGDLLMLHVSERNKKSANISDFEFTNIGISVKNPMQMHRAC